MFGARIAVAGKGGVGKTTVCGCLARIFARRGYTVLAVDADPAMNLWMTLGVGREVAEKIIPIASNEELVEERTGAKPGRGFGAIFSLTPRVSDIVDRFGVPAPDGVKLLVMGTVEYGGSGCMCPASALVRALFSHIVLARGELVLMDMEAGVEHLGRATARNTDLMLVVVEPSAKSVDVAAKISRLASDIGVRRVVLVGNKVSGEAHLDFLEKASSSLNLELLGAIPDDDSLRQAEVLGISPLDYSPSSLAIKAIENLANRIEELLGYLKR